MKTVWTQHIENLDEKIQFEKSLLNSKWILDHLNTLLDRLEDGLDHQELSPKAYDQPNWDYRQAHANGFRQCLRKIKLLTTLDQKDTNDQSI